MSSLLDFLAENPVENVSERVVISARLANFPFTIKGVSGQQFAEYQKQATKMGGKKKVEFDNKKFNELIVINHTVEPNFRDAEAIKKANCQTPEEFLYRSLLAGEIATLSEKISSLSGFDKDIDEEIEEAKNF